MKFHVGDLVQVVGYGCGYYSITKVNKENGNVLVDFGRNDVEWVHETHCFVDVKTRIQNAKQRVAAKKAIADKILSKPRRKK